MRPLINRKNNVPKKMWSENRQTLSDFEKIYFSKFFFTSPTLLEKWYTIPEQK